MEKIFKKIEEYFDEYIKNIEEKPIKTIIKTLIVIWLVAKVKKMLK